MKTKRQCAHSSTKSFSSSEKTAVIPGDGLFNRKVEEEKMKGQSSPDPSIPVYNRPRHPTSIFSFSTPTAYYAPPNPTANLAPVTQGSASRPNVVQLEINAEMQSNTSDVTTQFLAELHGYTTVSRHRSITAFFGCLENVGMVLEYIDGRTLVYEVIRPRSTLTRAQKIP